MNDKISPTKLCVPPSELREKVGCHCDGLQQRFLVIIQYLVPHDIKVILAIFVEIQALFPEILRFQFVTLFVKHPVHRLA